MSSAIGGIDDGFPGWAKALVTVFIYLPLTMIVVGGLIALLYRYAVSARTGFYALLPGAASATIALVLLVTAQLGIGPVWQRCRCLRCCCWSRQRADRCLHGHLHR